MERRLVRRHLEHADQLSPELLDSFRYVFSFARLTRIRNPDGTVVDVSGPLGRHSAQLREMVEPKLDLARSWWDLMPLLPELVARTRAARSGLLEHLPVSREALDREVTRRSLVVVSGGGGGAGYGYLGVYQALSRADLAPDLLVGTSIGALTSLFRARERHFDLAPIVSASQRLAWGDVLRVLESESRYGLPATLRLYLRAAMGSLFQHPDGRPLWLSDLAIPTWIIATGITVDALKHDLGFYEHFLDRDVRGGTRDGIRGIARSMGILREFLSRPDALVEIVLGRDPGTEDFDALDAAGFSASVPGVLHYDVLRPDERMRRILDDLYSAYGITRLGEGGMVANVAARIGWNAGVEGRLPTHQPFVVALDCFAPNPRRLAWVPLQQLVRAANVDRDRRFADLYLPLPRTLSPMNVVPALKDAMLATQWGHDSIQPYLPFLREMMRPIRVLGDG
jgi:hypothetical protein